MHRIVRLAVAALLETLPGEKERNSVEGGNTDAETTPSIERCWEVDALLEARGCPTGKHIVVVIGKS